MLESTARILPKQVGCYNLRRDQSIRMQMSAPLKNQFWKARSSHGRKPLFQTPEALWVACTEYFEWVDANPLSEAQAFAYRGVVKIQHVPKMRAMTITGLCIFLDISRQAWSEYTSRHGFGDVTTRVDDIIRMQKFQGAAAGLLNPNIIARDLGLADRKEIEGTMTLEQLVNASMTLNGDLNTISERTNTGGPLLIGEAAPRSRFE